MKMKLAGLLLFCFVVTSFATPLKSIPIINHTGCTIILSQAFSGYSLVVHPHSNATFVNQYHAHSVWMDATLPLWSQEKCLPADAAQTPSPAHLFYNSQTVNITMTHIGLHSKPMYLIHLKH